MANLILREITSEEIKNNFEKYYYNHQQFFIKIKNDKDLHIAYLYCIEEWDEKLEGESDEDFNNRDTKLIINNQEESEEDYIARVNKRRQALNAYNEQQDAEWVQKVEDILSNIKYQVDPITMQQLDKIIPLRIKDIIKDKTLQYPEIENALDQLNSDLSNVSELKEQLKEAQNAKIQAKLYQDLKELQGDFNDIDGNKSEIPTLNLGLTMSDLDNNLDAVRDAYNEVMSPESTTRILELLQKIVQEQQK